MSAPQLLEQDRVRLDGIVSKMIENGESDEDIQFVVNDFKQKYAGQPREKQGVAVPFTPFRVNASVDDVVGAVQKTLTGAYKYGGKPGSKEGTDCSGAMCVIAKQAGVNLPRTAKAQFEDKRAKTVKPEDLRPGDLVFFGSPGPSGWHVGFYQGNGKFLHQSTDNKPGLSVGDLNQHAKKYGFKGAKRYDELSAKFGGQAPVQGPVQGPQQTPRQKSGLDIVADALRKPEYAPNVAPVNVPPARNLQEVVDRPKTVAKAQETRKAKEGQRNVAIQQAVINTLNQEEMATRPRVGYEDLTESEINPPGARLVPSGETSARKVLEQSLGDPYRSLQGKVLPGLQRGVGKIATGLTGTQIDDPEGQAELERRMGSLLGAPGSVEELVLNAAIGVGATVAGRFAKPLVQAFAKGDKEFQKALDALPIAPELKPKFAEELGTQITKALDQPIAPKVETPSGLPPNLQPKTQSGAKGQSGGRVLYREANPSEFLSHDYRNPGAFYSDTPELAIGQGDNKGIIFEVEFKDTARIDEHAKPGLMPGGGKEYQLGANQPTGSGRAPGTLRAFTIKKGTKLGPSEQRAITIGEKSGVYRKEVLPNGDVRYTVHELPKVQPKPTPPTPPAVAKGAKEPQVKTEVPKAEFNHETATVDDYIRDLKAGKAQTDQHVQFYNNHGPEIEAKLKPETDATKTATPDVVPESKLKEALKDASAERQAAFDALQKARAKQNAARRGGKKSGAAAPILPEEIAYAKTWLKEKGLQAASAVEDFVNHMIDLGYDRATAKRILKASSDPETGAPTGLARQFEDVERKVLGLEPTQKPAQSAETLAEIGKDLSPQAASYVESSVVNNRALEPAEVAAVAHYKRGLANEYKELGTRLRNGDSSVLGRMTDIEREFDKISTAAQNTRTEWHDLGEALQVAFDPGYSRVDLKTRALRANQGEALSKKQSDEIDRVATRNEVADESLSQSRKSLTVEDIDEIDTLRKEVEGLKKQLEDKKATQTARQSSDRPRKMRANALGVLQKYGIKTAPIESTATRKVSKKAGFINIPVNGGDDITRAIRSLVRSYILDADKITLDEILTKLKTDVPGLDEDQALMILSNKYRTKLLEADVAKLDAERALREIVRDAEFRQKSTAGKAVSLSGNLLTATARGLQAGLDLSAPLIQGLPMLMQGSKADWIKAWKPMFQAAFAKGAKGGEEFAMLVNAEIKRHPMYARARKAGLDLTEMAGAFERQEEFFAGDLIETLSKSNIPGLKQYAQAIVRSNAAFNVFNNKARFDTFVRFAKLNPGDPDFLKDAAMMVNILSGRGSGEVARTLGSKAAGNVFYAPRFAWSGWQNASGVPVMFANTKLGRQVAIQNYAKGGAFMAITLGAASVSPFVKSVDTDIRSTNFGAITFKDGTQINPFARILQPYRTVAQAAFGRVSRAGNYTDPTDVEAQAKFGGGYLLNKLSPAARLVFTGFSGTMYDSDKEEWVAAEPGKLAMETITPMSWRNLFGSMSQKDATLIGKILSTGALLGMDTRRENTKKAESPAPPMNFLPEGWRVILGQRPLKQGESSAPKGAKPVSDKVGLPAGAKPVK